MRFVHHAMQRRRVGPHTNKALNKDLLQPPPQRRGRWEPPRILGATHGDDGVAKGEVADGCSRQ